MSSQHRNSDTSNVAVDASKLHFLAQNFNNQGCTAIVDGDLDEAIENLKNAMKLTHIVLANENEGQKQCSCKFCRIESILKISTEGNDGAHLSFTNEHQAKSIDSIKRNRSNHCVRSIDDTRMDIDDDDSKSNLHQGATVGADDAFIYNRPLFVSQHSIDRFHYMGETLSFVVLFNIALAYHIKAIQTLPFISNRDEIDAALQQPLKLYELAYQLYFQCQIKDKSFQETDATSITADKIDLRLSMLVTNNISQIHKLAGNDIKHLQCLEHLLNALMFMTCNIGSNLRRVILTDGETDGMFENLSPILMSDEYAAAA